MPTPLLDQKTIENWLAGHPSWRLEAAEIRLETECANFPSAIELVRSVAERAEAADHHPDIDIRWRTVRFALSTHSEGGLTQKDLDLAEQIDDLLSQS